MRGSARRDSSKAATPVRPSTRAAAAAYGMENLAPSMLAGAASVMRRPKGMEVMRTRVTCSAVSLASARIAMMASSAGWFMRQQAWSLK